MRIVPFLLFSAIFLVACHQKVAIDQADCIQNEIFDAEEELVLSDVKLDSIQFSGGTYHYSIEGKLRVAMTQYPFSVLLDQPPIGAGQLKVLGSVFPFRDIDSSHYTCVVYGAQNKIIIDWENAVKRLKVSLDPSLF